MNKVLFQATSQYLWLDLYWGPSSSARNLLWWSQGWGIWQSRKVSDAKGLAGWISKRCYSKSLLLCDFPGRRSFRVCLPQILPASSKMCECAADDIEHVVKDKKSTNSDIRGKWRKCLLLEKGEKDPRLKSTEAKEQRKWVGHVNIQFFLNLWWKESFCDKFESLTEKVFFTSVV